MAKTKSKESSKLPLDLKPLLAKVAEKLTASGVLKKGTIVVRASGDGGGDYYLECADRGAWLVKGQAVMETPPTIEIFGDVRQLHGVLSGQKDARKRFLAGSFRLRGDLRYFSDLAMELGILKDPL